MATQNCERLIFKQKVGLIEIGFDRFKKSKSCARYYDCGCVSCNSFTVNPGCISSLTEPGLYWFLFYQDFLIVSLRFVEQGKHQSWDTLLT